MCISKMIIPVHDNDMSEWNGEMPKVSGSSGVMLNVDSLIGKQSG